MGDLLGIQFARARVFSRREERWPPEIAEEKGMLTADKKGTFHFLRAGVGRGRREGRAQKIELQSCMQCRSTSEDRLTLA